MNRVETETARTRAREIASFWPRRPQKLVKTNTLNQP